MKTKQVTVRIYPHEDEEIQRTTGCYNSFFRSKAGFPLIERGNKSGGRNEGPRKKYEKKKQKDLHLINKESTIRE